MRECLLYLSFLNYAERPNLCVLFQFIEIWLYSRLDPNLTATIIYSLNFNVYILYRWKFFSKIRTYCLKVPNSIWWIYLNLDIKFTTIVIFWDFSRANLIPYLEYLDSIATSSGWYLRLLLLYSIQFNYPERLSISFERKKFHLHAIILEEFHFCLLSLLNNYCFQVRPFFAMNFIQECLFEFIFLFP